MILIKEYLENLRNGNKLKDYVLDYYIDEAQKLDNNELIKSMVDLQKYGCQSGMIGSLIYYNDTNKFYDTYQEEIIELLNDLIYETGCSMEELFGDKFDRDDPLFLECFNKNLMAWFGFETTASKIYNQIYEKFKPSDLDFVF